MSIGNLNTYSAYQDSAAFQQQINDLVQSNAYLQNANTTTIPLTSSATSFGDSYEYSGATTEKTEKKSGNAGKVAVGAAIVTVGTLAITGHLGKAFKAGKGFVKGLFKNADEVVEAGAKNADKVVDDVADAAGKKGIIKTAAEKVGNFFKKTSEDATEEALEQTGKNADEVVEAGAKNADEVAGTVADTSKKSKSAVENAGELSEAGKSGVDLIQKGLKNINKSNTTTNAGELSEAGKSGVDLIQKGLKNIES